MNSSRHFLLVLPLLTIPFFSCSTKNKPDNTSSTLHISDSIPSQEPAAPNYFSGRHNDLNNYKSISPELLPEGTVFPFTGKMAISDIVDYVFILDTLIEITTDTTYEISFNKIAGITTSNFFITNQVIPEMKDSILRFFSFSRDTIIIPLRFSLDYEMTFLSRWKKIKGDSVEYIDYYKTAIGTKYAYVEITDVISYAKTQFMISRIHSGEGGDYGESLALIRIDPYKRLTTKLIDEVGWNHDDDTIPGVGYELHKNGLTTYKLSYLKNENGGTGKLPIRKEFFQKILFKDFL